MRYGVGLALGPGSPHPLGLGCLAIWGQPLPAAGAQGAMGAAAPAAAGLAGQRLPGDASFEPLTPAALPFGVGGVRHAAAPATPPGTLWRLQRPGPRRAHGQTRSSRDPFGPTSDVARSQASRSSRNGMGCRACGARRDVGIRRRLPGGEQPAWLASCPSAAIARRAPWRPLDKAGGRA